jgi:hypothetical protein
MGGRRIGAFLRAKARDANPNGSIVELGCWLGAGTAQMALGVLERPDNAKLPIHCFDNFHTSADSARKAALQGVPEITEGSDTLPWVENRLGPFGDFIHLHKGMIDRTTRWDGSPISLFVDDASKYAHTFYTCLSIFGPSWIVGETTVVLMDFYLFRKQKPDVPQARIDSLRCQFDFIEKHKDNFAPAGDLVDGTCAAFRYVKPIDFNALPQPAWPHDRK